MVRFLIKRPIAVTMAFLAIVILGCVTFTALPVSLLPDVDIPHIMVRIYGGDMSAREVENVLTSPLRRQLMQIEGLDHLKSETNDYGSVVDLSMEYGVDTDLAFVEVNEKIDAAMASYPAGTIRPKAIKANASDIPVLYINITLRDSLADFDEMATVADNIIRRRLEQLPEVAMADISGLPSNELKIIPDRDKMASAGLTDIDIREAVEANNTVLGSMTVRDGHYEYNVQLDNRILSAEDLKNVRLVKNSRQYSIGDFCRVELSEKMPSGYSIYNGRRAVTMAIIKHNSASMFDMHDAIDKTLDYFRGQYPSFSIDTSRSQSQLLDFTISNLEQNLVLGLVFVFLVCVLFMRNIQLPFVISITIIVAVIITFLLFYLFKVSINIASLAGLILAVGMMIDNSVIVAENITQYRRRGLGIDESCVRGTNEMITPLLSSTLTTVAVFVPLVFMSGIAGAIFADQGFAITAGLIASYITGITLMPTLYRIFFFRSKIVSTATDNHSLEKNTLVRLYDKGMSFTFRHKIISLAFVVVAIMAVYPLFYILDVEKMPRLDSSESIVKIDWNEEINLYENRRRAELVMQQVDSLTEEYSASVGISDYMLENTGNGSPSDAEIYLKTESPSALNKLQTSLTAVINARYPLCNYEFTAPENVFEKVFSSTDPPLEASLVAKKSGMSPPLASIREIAGYIGSLTGQKVTPPNESEQINISIDHEAALLYGIDQREVPITLGRIFHGSDVGTLKSSQDYMPIRIVSPQRSIDDAFASEMITSNADKDGNTHAITLKALVKTSTVKDFKTLVASEAGEYFPLAFDVTEKESKSIMAAVNDAVSKSGEFDVTFSGTLFYNKKMIRELMIIMLVSLLMMYFILCAQFESFLQPLIVLIEIPIDISIAFVSLWVCGQTMNLMSAIGIIVTCGIVVNDSILKMDAINGLRKEKKPLMKAIHTAGQRRITPIVMTSLTTVAAMVPVLFGKDMGDELQRPLAIALIGSMIVGTLVSIFIIPLIYYLVYRKKYGTQNS
ncbi:MAG: efflux RND transporter permease subunit [Muribaculum sp.]|nr:efflux RND transporter permease subunit [Muribaculum sp.]